MPRFAGAPVEEVKGPRFGGSPVEAVGKTGVTREQRQAEMAAAQATFDKLQRENQRLDRQAAIGRGLNIGGRSILEGLVALPDMLVAPATEAVNSVLPERFQQMNLTQGVNYLADLLGGRRVRPETGGERVLADTLRGTSAAATGLGLANQATRAVSPVVQRIGQSLSAQPGAQIVGGGLSGAAQGGTREAGGGGFLQALAGLAGGALPFGPGAFTRPNSTAAERRAGQVIIRESEDPRRLMTPNPSQVPGVVRSLSEESGDAGVAALERQMRGYRPQMFNPVDRANAANRVASIRQIAGEESDMADAIRARSDVTRDLRDTAFREADDIAVQAAQYGASPSGNVDSLRQQFQAIAAQQGGRSAVGRTVDAVLNELDAAEGSAQGLYNVRKSINDLIEGKAGSDKDFARAAQAELIQMRSLVDAELANIAPSFEAYLSAFQNMSRPINRMEMGREILDRAAVSVPDMDTGVRALTPAGMSRQTLDLDALARRATGFENARADQILTPNDTRVIGAVQDDLERQYFRSTASAPGGSPTEPREALAKRLAGAMASKIPGAGTALEMFRNVRQEQQRDLLTYLIQNPIEARRVLSSMAPRDRQVLTKAMIQMSQSRPPEDR